MKEQKFIPLEHMADIKYLVNGNSLNKVFENAVLAFSSYISSDSKIKSDIKKIIKIESSDRESLLYRFIDELIYLLDTENFAVSKAKVKIKETSLNAVLYGESTKKIHCNHVKAATYAEMYIKKTKSGWEAQFVLDV